MKRLAAILVCALSLTVTTQVKADAVVHVKVRSSDNKPVDGRVELTGDGGTFTCTTSQGTCTMRAVPGGRYLAVFKPNNGSATAPKKVMIPPDGKADLHIAAK
ncbi:MAG: hypothetical protein JRG67_17240 [Deltaproteobacteria bacterium]|nr:hypothetical protein [Deltaproteobacteria bacterium]MBW1876557.1 hypothetical protein [Deltaproteobacteria bacterium]MBW2212749.1 hypothetical protein [Deltaproteobacteria bacterium]MBW2381370.1 hypothetical protein [Deltaproteobacteria bacterium]MBW2552384.1 hypothetical protein [Deltaproteobacteria bacterium]